MQHSEPDNNERGTSVSLKAAFNSLSGVDKFKFKAAATAKVMSTYIREDTERHPWKSPLYMSFLFVLATPLPFPGASYIIMLGTVAFVSLRLTAWSRKMHDQLTAAKSDESLVREYGKHIVPNRKNPGTYCVDNWAFTKMASKDSLNDVGQTFKMGARWAYKTFKSPWNKPKPPGVL